MPHVAGQVHPQPALPTRQELREGLERPVDAVECLGGHPLDLGEQPGEEGPVLEPGRCHRESAVSSEHGGHPVEAGRRGVGVPGDLGVVVGVGVDDARGYHLAGGVELLVCAVLGQIAHRRHAAVHHADIGPPARVPGPVHEYAVPDDELVVLRHGPAYAPTGAATLRRNRSSNENRAMALPRINFSTTRSSMPCVNSRATDRVSGQVLSECG